jgi:5'-3' exonuclease
MGVPLFYRWIENNNKNNLTLISNILDLKIDFLMIDMNCLLHPCVEFVVNEYKNGKIFNITKRDDIEKLIWEKIEEFINDLLKRLNPLYLFVAVDGVAPMGKINQQRQRRYKQNEIEINEFCPFKSLELTPGTPYMERLHNQFIKYCDKLNIKYKYSSCYEEGEGEHKIMNFIKKNGEKNKNIVIYGLDADLLFLSLTDNLKNNMYVMREKQYFDNKSEKNVMDNIEKIVYNYVNINEFHKIINDYNINSDEFIILCYLLGNDFMPSILSLNIKKKGIENLIKALLIVKKNNKNKNLVNNDKINYEMLLEILKNVFWTEKKYFEYNSTFNNGYEYYKYYLKKNIEIEEQKKSMVKKYIETIEWCYKYYNEYCCSWKHYYNYNAPPLIEDIIQYYPKEINIEIHEIKLKPIEQLILVIPLKFYYFVFDKNVLKKIKNNKEFLKIKYMLPNKFITDKNRENIEWKQNIIVPFIDYEYFLKIMDLINL